MTAIAYDREQPRPSVAVTIAVEVAERAQHRVLDDILRIMLVAQKIARERVRIVQMRQYNSFEPLYVALRHVVLEVIVSLNETPGAGFLFPHGRGTTPSLLSRGGVPGAGRR
jgi:hypothetical protein